jgi:hypothetical protein
MKPTLVAALWLGLSVPAIAQDLGLGFPLTAPGRAALETGLDLAASALANALQYSRDQARAAGTLRMPAHIRAALLDHYPADILDRIEYRIGVTEDTSIQSAAIRYGDATAVTTIDTITFANPWDAENNIALWGHEVKHVEQFQAWGVYGFAQRYVRDYEAVERDAFAIGAALRLRYGGG